MNIFKKRFIDPYLKMPKILILIDNYIYTNPLGKYIDN